MATIEEKAKAYDRAFERAKKLHETCDSQAVVGWCEYIFPELHESEDEKVREDIISLVNEFWERIGSINPEYSSRNRMLAWLEKQGTYTKKDVDDAFVEGMAFAKNELEKQSEQKLPIEKLPSEMKTIGESLGFTTQEECDEYNQMVSDLIMSDNDKVEPKFKVGDIVRKKDGDGLEWTVLSAENNNCYKIANEDYDNVVFLDDTWEVVEQVPIWSKEDERILKGILGYIGHGQHYGVSNSEMLTWLKSLKERIGE